MSMLNNMQGVASRLLKANGERVVFSRESGKTYNAATGENTGGAPSTFSGYCHPTPYDLREIDGTFVQQGDVRLLVESMTSTPRPGDTVTFRNEEYRVMSVIPLSVQGGDAAQYVQVRK